MNADFSRIKNRVTELLNACPAGTFQSVLDTRNKTRSTDAIEAACYEGALEVLKVLASVPNEFRKDFVTVVSVAHGEFLPEHLGDVVKIEIQPYSGASWREADVKSKSYLQIESYRNDGFLYDSKAHDEQGSSLSGFADVWEDKFYFTGYAAQVGCARVVRADALTKLPEIFEATAVKLAISFCPKAGDNAATLAIAKSYGNEGRADLMEFKTGKRVFSEVSAPAPNTKVHTE